MQDKYKKLIRDIIVAVLGVLSGFFTAQVLSSCSSTGKVNWDMIFNNNKPIERGVDNE